MSQQLILLVEDNEDSCIVYKAMLEHLGYAVMCAVDGAEGVEYARRHKPHMILMDISLPVMDGFEATRVIRDDPSIGNVPIVALTAYDLTSERCRKAGFNGCLMKPIDPSRVAEEIEPYLAQSS